MKKLLALLLSLAIIVSLCACKKETEETLAATEVSATLPEDISEVKNLSAKVTVTSPEGEYEGELKLDLETERSLAAFSVDGVLGTLCVADGKIYMLEESEGGLPRGSVQDMTDSALSEKLTKEQLTLIGDILLNKKDFTMDVLSEFGILSQVKLALATNGITAEQAENAVNTVIDLMHDDTWQDEHLSVSTQTDGEDTAFTVETDITKALMSLLTEAAAALGVEDDLNLADEIQSMPVKVEGRFTRNIPVVITLSLTEGESEYSMKIEFHSFNDTTLDTDAVISKLTEAHGDYTECRECGLEDLYFQGYCEYCASVKCCQNFCGEDAGEDGYCDNCRVPCAGGCGNHADHEEGYCFDCYYEVYCYEDCGNKATNMTEYDGYCDDCYNPCKECSEQAVEVYDGYCYYCYYERYCYENCGNEAVHFSAYEFNADFVTGYCDDCYIKCADCDNHAEYDGIRCYSCYHETHCIYCDAEATMTVDGYGVCDECYEEN